MQLFKFKSTPQNRIQKYANYRRQILKMDSYSQMQDSKPTVEGQDHKRFQPTIQVLMWLMGTTVIILLILVVALVYFGR
ncbi:MAG: hypothetical protein ACO207_00590 [Bacilli bacterium]